MKPSHLFIFLLILILIACGPAGSDLVTLAELPDPVIYSLSLSELPDVGLQWQQSYNQTTIEEADKWSYVAYQAYQPGSLSNALESGFAVNNDVILYTVDMSRADLPQPPSSLGNIDSIKWKSTSPLHRLGDKTAVWKTTLGDLFTPVWWLEFYLGHAYVRISLLGFPDQIAPALLFGMGDLVASRLPRSPASLRSDAATIVATPAQFLATALPFTSPTPGGSQIPVTTPATSESTLSPLSYTAPMGETGMVSFLDDTGNQLADGITGSDDILSDLGNSSAYEWVGWTDLTEPITLTFTFTGEVNISAVEIGINHREGLGIFVPSQVSINGLSFDLAADAIPNNQRMDLRFTGPFNGPTVQIILHHESRGWILVDEVRFFAEK